jgi:RHS repeat-associated protein
VLFYEHKKAVPRNARYYDSDTGRFISPDPTVPDITNTQMYNRYMFVGGNPISFMDVDGYQEEQEKSTGTQGITNQGSGKPEKTESSRNSLEDLGEGDIDSSTNIEDMDIEVDEESEQIDQSPDQQPTVPQDSEPQEQSTTGPQNTPPGSDEEQKTEQDSTTKFIITIFTGFRNKTNKNVQGQYYPKEHLSEAARDEISVKPNSNDLDYNITSLLSNTSSTKNYNNYNSVKPQAGEKYRYEKDNGDLTDIIVVKVEPLQTEVQK